MDKNKREEAAEKVKQEAAEKPAKMTIYEYEQKYVKRQNARGAKFLLRFIAAVIGIFLFVCLFFFTHSVWEMNIYAGYAAAAASALVYICFFIVPLFKIMRSDYFVVNVNAYSAKAAKRHNRKLRRSIAEKIIDVTSKVEGAGWYDSQTVGRLAIAVNAGDEEGIKAGLTALFNGSVKKSSRDLILKGALKSAAYSAVSQTAAIDSALVAFVNLQLIKDIVFLYGFRPSDAKLVKIFGRVLQNSLIAYGMGGLRIGNTVARTMSGAIKGVPVLGAAVSAIVDSSVQGLTNGALTAVIGYQTIKYLNDEYKLQDILDGVDIPDTEEEISEACEEIEKELKRETKLARAG